MELTAYDALSGPDGYREFRNAIQKSFGGRSEDILENGFTEWQMTSIVRGILLESDESIVVTMMDLFDTEARGRFDISHVYVLFLLVAALESKQLLQFLHKFGRTLFEMLATKNSQVPYDRYT